MTTGGNTPLMLSGFRFRVQHLQFQGLLVFGPGLAVPGFSGFKFRRRFRVWVNANPETLNADPSTSPRRLPRFRVWDDGFSGVGFTASVFSFYGLGFRVCGFRFWVETHLGANDHWGRDRLETEQPEAQLFVSAHIITIKLLMLTHYCCQW